MLTQLPDDGQPRRLRDHRLVSVHVRVAAPLDPGSAGARSRPRVVAARRRFGRVRRPKRAASAVFAPDPPLLARIEIADASSSCQFTTTFDALARAHSARFFTSSRIR